MKLSMYFFLLLITITNAQVSKYIDQDLPGVNPEIFAEGFISTEAFEFAGTFSPDFTEYFFTRRSSSSDNRIYVTKFSNNEWSVPQRASFSTDNFEFLPNITPDGKRLYYCSERPSESEAFTPVWYVEKDNDKWSIPIFFSSPLNKAFMMYISTTIKGKMYYTGRGEILTSTPENGKYLKSERIDNTINTLHPAHPYISPTEDILLFDVQKVKDGDRTVELYYSKKSDDGNWQQPVRFDDSINQPGYLHMCASMSPDGKFIFFARYLENEGNIYWVSSKVIK